MACGNSEISHQHRNQHPANQNGCFVAGLTSGFSSTHPKSNPNPTAAAALHSDTVTSPAASVPAFDRQPTPEILLSPSCSSQAGVLPPPLPSHCFRGSPHNAGLSATQGEHTQNPALLAQSVLREDLCSCVMDDLLCPLLRVHWQRAGARTDLFPVQMATEALEGTYPTWTLSFVGTS